VHVGVAGIGRMSGFVLHESRVGTTLMPQFSESTPIIHSIMNCDYCRKEREDLPLYAKFQSITTKKLEISTDVIP
jgi:hypothetical protein